jgi:hypothetical protein
MASWFTRAFTPSKSAKRTAIKAAEEQERATRMAQAAATNEADSEGARSASDERLRKLARMRGLAGTDKGGRSAPASVGYKMLMGT